MEVSDSFTLPLDITLTLTFDFVYPTFRHETYSYYSFWQYADSPEDEDYWNGTAASLKTFATG